MQVDKALQFAFRSVSYGKKRKYAGIIDKYVRVEAVGVQTVYDPCGGI